MKIGDYADVYVCPDDHVSSVHRPQGNDPQGNPKPGRCFFCPKVVEHHASILVEPLPEPEEVEESELFHCPHCHEPLPPVGHKPHVCADHKAWTRAEKDAMRAVIERRYGPIPYGPSSESIGAR